MKDFGFNAVSLEELTVFQEQDAQHQQDIIERDAWQNKASELRTAIQPLLDNLRADPQKDYILWPNRESKIKEFEDYLDSILHK